MCKSGAVRPIYLLEAGDESGVETQAKKAQAPVPGPDEAVLQAAPAKGGKKGKQDTEVEP